MSSIGSLQVDLALQSAQFIAGLKQATTASNIASRQMNNAFNFMKGAAGAFVGVLSVDAFMGAMRGAFDYADAIVDLSDKTGASTKAIQEFRYAAQMSGSSVASADAAIGKFTKNLGSALNGNKAMATGLRELGVTSSNVDEALRQFADGVAKLPTKAQQNAAAMEFMGKSAGDLTLLLSKGSEGLSDLARKAQQLGIVMEEDVLRNAGEVNDKLDTLRMIVNADMANMFVQNASAIAGMVEQLIRLAGAATQALAAMDRRNAIASVKAEGQPFFNDPAWIPAKLKGISTKEQRDQDRRYLMSTHEGRADLYREYATAHNTALKGGDRAAAAKFREQAQGVKTYDQLAKLRGQLPRTGNGANAPVITGGGVSSHKAVGGSGKDLVKEEEQRREAFNRELFAAQRSELQARLSLTSDVTDQANIKRQLLDREHSEEQRLLALDIKGGKIKGDINSAQSEAGQLFEAMNATYASDLASINNDETRDLARQSAEKATLKLQFEEETNQALASEARSMKDKRRYLLASVEANFKIAISEQESVLANDQASKHDREIAAAKKAQLEAMKGHAKKEVEKQTQGPLEAYLDSIPRTADELKEEVEKIEVEGLDNLKNDLTDCIMGTKSLGDAFKDMANTIISGLIKIAIQQAIIKPLGNLLFGAGGRESSGGGVLGGLLGGIVKGISGKRANGGMTQAGDYLVGERGPEIVRIGNSANVMSNSALRAVAGAANDNGRGLTINFGNITSNDPAMVKLMAHQAIAEALPVLSDQASNTTFKRAGRRKL